MKKAKIIIAGLIGNILEYYDIALYGFLAPKLASLFFPTGDIKLVTIASFATFAIGFLMRPLGGAFFGHIGDRFGRKNALLVSMLLTATSTCTIGCLPDYSTVGIIAPLGLLLCRLLQGFSIGGESGGVLVYNLENAPKEKINFYAGLLCSASYAGTILGAAVSTLFTLQHMPAWSWRIPFWLGGILAFYAFYLRMAIGESPAFVRAKDPVAKIPFVEILKHAKRNFICIVGLGAACSVAYHLLIIYTNSVFTNHLRLPLTTVLRHNVFLLILLALLLPIAGLIADKIGNGRMMKGSMAGITILAYPYFLFLDGANFQTIVFIQIAFTVVFSGFLGPVGGCLMDLFALRTRYSGIGIGYNLGNALLGGSSPFIAATLVHWTSNPVMPALYLMLAGCIGWCSVKFADTK